METEIFALVHKNIKVKMRILTFYYDSYGLRFCDIIQFKLNDQV